jgi:lysyl-tRNA synthetase class II
MTANPYTNLEQIRLEKIERLKARGIEPYPNRAERTHTSLEAIKAFEAAEAAGQAEGLRVTLAGRIRSTGTAVRRPKQPATANTTSLPCRLVATGSPPPTRR